MCMNNYIGIFIIEEKKKRLEELKRRLDILNQGRSDNGGGDSFIPDHMNRLTD